MQNVGIYERGEHNVRSTLGACYKQQRTCSNAHSSLKIAIPPVGISESYVLAFVDPSVHFHHTHRSG